MIITNDLSLPELTALCQQRIDALFADFTQHIPASGLKQAMAYTLSNPGKRLRPLLVYATGSIFNAAWENLDVPAVAVELMHTYSLIHDDLPAMDNADLRRGKPTCHKVFNEGMAVLTGDAILTLSMQVLATQPATISAAERLELITILTNACGPNGMAAGQALDLMVLADANLSETLLLEIYKLKTGALFSACIEMGWVVSDQNKTNHQALCRFADLLGLAFQLQDDLLDIEASTATLGKTAGIDALLNKKTYPLLFGIEKTKQKIATLYDEALANLNYLGNKAHLLRELTQQMLLRKK